MDEALVELTREWLLKARHDLENARIVSRDPEGPLESRQRRGEAIRPILISSMREISGGTLDTSPAAGCGRRPRPDRNKCRSAENLP